MNEYEKLLENVSDKYHIYRGAKEPENDWKARVIYSICGMMAYTSLWDDEKSISIVHLKRRVRRILKDYLSLYPSVSNEFPAFTADEEAEKVSPYPTTIEDEIADQFLKTGVVYHKPYRIVPAMKREEKIDNICFQRGLAPESISCVSGLGFYSLVKEASSLAEEAKEMKDIRDMFGLSQDNLKTVWEKTLSAASWKSVKPFETPTKYLLLNPPFSYGYWTNKPDKTGQVSILRTGQEGALLYYLYRYENNKLKVSPLPPWQVESHNYRALSCALLSENQTLPPIEYSVDGSLVHVHLNYLLPPRELHFLKLYSWPERANILPSNFHRKLTKVVFTVMRKILTEEGYAFKEK